MDESNLKAFRDRFALPITDDKLKDLPYYTPGPDSAEVQYMKKARQELGGFLPYRQSQFEGLQVPALDKFSAQTKGTGEREISTTMASCECCRP